MPLLLETIKIEDGKVFNLSYHQKRLDRTQKALFGLDTDIDLSLIIEAPSKGLYRCRIVYDTHIHSVEYIPYKEKHIQKLKVLASHISYPYKYENREAFTALLQANSQDYDEIIIEKEGYITDTSISNLAFYDGENWFTPASPLLEGTMRAKLLDEKFLITKQIKKEDIQNYTHVALMNAMIGFKILKNPKITT